MLGLNERSTADELGARVLRALGRVPAIRLFGSAGRTAVIAIFTLGYGPAFLWIKRSQRLVQNEVQQFEHLSEWIRLHTASPRSSDLMKLATSCQLSLPLQISAAVLNAGSLIFVLFQIIRHRLGLEETLAATYLHWWIAPRTAVAPVATQVYVIWATSLVLVYSLIALTILIHIRDVRRFITELAALATDESIAPPPIPIPGARPGVRWIVSGILLAIPSAPWAIPLMICGGMLKKYQFESGLARAHLGKLFACFLNASEPATGVPFVAWMDRCGKSDCRQELPVDARFCPRCGRRVELQRRTVKIAGG